MCRHVAFLGTASAGEVAEGAAQVAPLDGFHAGHRLGCEIADRLPAIPHQALGQRVAGGLIPDQGARAALCKAQLQPERRHDHRVQPELAIIEAFRAGQRPYPDPAWRRHPGQLHHGRSEAVGLCFADIGLALACESGQQDRKAHAAPGDAPGLIRAARQLAAGVQQGVQFGPGADA